MTPDWNSVLTAILTVAAVHFVVLISPGPDFAMVVQNSVVHSRRTAIWTSLGIAAGIWIHVAYCLLGLGVIIAGSAMLFEGIKLLGAGYLIYFGIKSLRAKPRPLVTADASMANAPALSNKSAFRQGILCNAFNPKVTMLFLGIFTLVIKPGTPFWVQLLCGLEVSVASFLWFTLVARVITLEAIRTRFSKMETAINRVMGAVLIAFGLRLALARRG